MHIGPKTVGARRTGVSGEKIEYKYEDEIVDGETIDVGASPAEKAFAEQENKRQSHQRQIVQAFKGLKSSQGDENQPNVPVVNGASLWDRRNANFPRFDEIAAYFVDNRNALAIDTMHFAMGEHVLFAHISRQNGIQLTPEELRDFLKICEAQKSMSSYVVSTVQGQVLTHLSISEVGRPPGPSQLIVTKIAAGWPPHVPKLRNIEDATQEELDEFEGFATLAAQSNDCDSFRFVGQWDYDIEEFMQITNLAAEDHYDIDPRK